jgi:hypothetical protein
MTRHKFGAKRTECGAGHSHPSKAEATRCDELHLLQSQGLIARLEREPSFRIVHNGKLICTYKADFAYFANNKKITEDVKGMLTPVYRLKKKLVEAFYPGVEIVEVRK